MARPKKLSKRVKEATTRGRAAIAALREAEEIDSTNEEEKAGEREGEGEGLNGIQCSTCQQWRQGPKEAIDIAMEAQEWHCSMNTWDPDRANCRAAVQPWIVTNQTQL